MGMTDGQFKAFLREQIAWEEAIKEKLDEGNNEEAMKLLTALIQRAKDNLEDI